MHSTCLFMRRVGNTKSKNAYFGGRLNSSKAPAKAIAQPMTLLDFGAFVKFTPGQIKQTLTSWGNADKYEEQQSVARELS